MGSTERLAAFLAAETTASASTSADVNDVVENMLLDTVGVTLAAANEEAVERAAATLAPTSDSDPGVHVPGRAERYDVRDAAFLTGIASHALDFDDLHHGMGGHPSSPVVSAVLPLAASLGSDGDAMLNALLLGAETELALSEALNPGHYESGWHPTSVLGHLGATAAAGALYGLDESEFRHALGVAASSAGGLKGNFGSMTKPYHVGKAARDGVVAARLAREGFTANPDILEEEFGGFCERFADGEAHDLQAALARLGDPWCAVDPPVAFKPYPCCGSVHAAIDAARAIRADGDVDAGHVERIDVTEHPRRLPHTDRPDPETALEGKFSLQYCVAVALERGDVWLDDFTDEAVNDQTVRAVADRVRAHADETMPEYGARVELTTTNGESHVQSVDAPRGTADNPMGDDELESKYRRCARRTLDDARVDRSVRLLRSVRETDADALLETIIHDA